ncbi:MAG: ribonuclease HII [Clostridia bacterium]|nr:ribonuclease HII [Clostridia bacterium]
MNFDIETALMEKGYTLIGGIDEAGRGPLAGPVCAACVILDPNNIPEGLNDSKKLSEKKREKLFDEIMACATVSCVLVDEKTIDEINILEATKLAMRRAVEKLSVTPDYLLIDGNFTIGSIKNEQFVIGGDAKSQSIAAASIIAKVTRDRFMLELDKQYPQYNFAKHKGYGTKEHIEKIRAFGPSPCHRASFLTKIL